MAGEEHRGRLTRPAELWRRIGGLGLIGAALVLLLAVIVWGQTRQLTLVGQALRSGDGYSVLSLYQVEIEYLRLREQWRRSVIADDLELAPLQLRYDVWVSRIALARTPSLQRLMADDEGYSQAVVRLRAFVDQADLELGVDRTPDRAALVALAAPLEELAGPVHDLTLAAAHRVAERADASNRALHQQSRFSVTLTVALGALCLVFGGLAMRQMRQLNQRRSALEDLAARLQEARREAETASAAKSTFLANMSHEIRTPFQGLLGMLSLLRESGLTPRQAEQLRIATESSDHLLAILNDILDLSQLESGRLTLSPAPLDLRALLRQVEALMRPPASAKSLALHLDAEPTVPEWIVADATRVKQVLFNLLSNAIKFSLRGSVALDIRTDAGPPPRLRFIVTDTGPGMNEATLATLFRRFSPGDRGAARHHGGAGLGLEISRNLARLMGGDISVTSRLGEGSRFSFEMPLVLPTAPQVRAAEPPDDTRALRPLRVLVAEDHPINRQYLASLFETLRHPAHFVADGREAVLALEREAFDLVLMDLHMPGLDGIGATLAIRALPDRQAATVPIIALTADAFQETRERCLLAGMNDFLTKPVSPQDLAAALRRLFGQEAVDGRSAANAPRVAPSLAPVAPLIDGVAVERVLQAMTTARLSALIGGFLDDGPRTVARLRAAVRDGQPLELRAHAHAARGVALNLGLAALAQTAQALHEGAAHLPAHEVAHLVKRFEDLITRTRRAAAEAGLLEAAAPAG
ncbi:MAG: ATP-binding protein [Rubrivivax sp.]